MLKLILIICALGFISQVAGIETKTLTIYDPSKFSLVNNTNTMVAVTDDIVGFAFPNDNKIVYYKKDEFMADNLNNPEIVDLSSTYQIKEHHSNTKYINTVMSRDSNDFWWSSAHLNGSSIEHKILCLYYKIYPRSHPYDYLRSQYSETFIIYVVKGEGYSTPSWFISENKQGSVYDIYREEPIGIAIRDINTTHGMIYYTTKNSDGVTYTMNKQKADTTVRVFDHESFDAGSNCGDVITANEHIIVLSCTTFPGGIISVFRESDNLLYVALEG